MNSATISMPASDNVGGGVALLTRSSGDSPSGQTYSTPRLGRASHRWQLWPLRLQMPDFAMHLNPQFGIQIAQRLVQQQEVGADHQSPGQRNLAAADRRRAH